MSTFREREAARRARIDPLSRAKIDRPRAEDRAQAARTPLELDRWYWVELFEGERWPGRVLGAVEPIGYAVGLAVFGTTQLVRREAIGRRLTGAELSDRLRFEPVGRDWVIPDDARTRVASGVPEPGGERQRA